MVSDQHVYEEIERRKKEEREEKEKEERIAKRPWVKLFDRNLISEKKFEQLLLNATEEIKNKMKNPKHGSFITQTKEGNYAKLIWKRDENGHVGTGDNNDAGKEALQFMGQIMRESNNKREDEHKLLYQKASYQINNCKTRAATMIKQLRDGNALRGSLLKQGHVAGDLRALTMGNFT